MKVLMFGWEFPPHISGGLGTACFGLTKALLKERMKVLFVVPRLFGDETDASSFLIDASAVTSMRRHKNGMTKARTRTEVKQLATISDGTIQHHGSGSMTYLEVASPLSPYETALRHQTIAQPGLSSWNYRMIAPHDSNAGTVSACFDIERLTEATEVKESAFTFSGTYGKNLLEEVKRYACIAGTIAKKYSFDIIHVHDWMTFPAGVVVKRKSNKPLVVHVHSTEFDRSGAHINKEVYEIEKLGFTEADKIVAVSKWTKQIVMSRYDVPEEKISVVHNGILPKDQAKPFDFPDIGSHFVTFLGRVTHQKGPWFFVEAAQKVLQEFPEAHFIVAGAGDLLPQIIERVAQLNMSARFHFTGFLSENQVDHIWSLTDVYVMPSVSEPFGIAPLEAIQGGVPVILSNQSGVAEVMPHAIKVDFWDTKALAAAICSVLRYESLSHVLRHNSKQHIESLTWDKAAAGVKRVYHEVRGKK
jgi:glycogen(starch) synthase